MVVFAKYDRDGFYPARVLNVLPGRRRAQSVQVQYLGYADIVWLPRRYVKTNPPKPHFSKASQPSRDVSDAETVAIELGQSFEEPTLATIMYDLRSTLAWGLQTVAGEMVRLFVFGSAMNGFGTEKSDIDVIMEVESASEVSTDKASVKKWLWLAKECFRGAESEFHVKEYISGARIPILRLVHNYTRRELDLSVNNMTPLLNTYLLRAYALLDTRVQKLGKSVKQWAKDKGMCDASRGWLSSYDLVLMALYFLQARKGLPSLQVHCVGEEWCDWDEPPPLMVRNLPKGESADQWLRDFFAFYAEMFDWGNEVVSVRLGQRLPRSDVAFKKLREAPLDIEDPFQAERNLGSHFLSMKKCDQFRQVIVSESRRTLKRKAGV